MLKITNPDWIAQALVLAHEPLARKIARGYAACGLELDDLVSAANVGLLEAAKRFDENRGCSFGIYATPWVQAECRQLARANSSVVKVPRPTTGKKPQTTHDVSLNAPISDDGKQSERGATFYLKPHDDIYGLQPLSPEDELSELNDVAERKSRLETAIATLSDRERLIFIERRLRAKPTELRALAERFGISIERVRQVDEVALKKVQKRIDRKPVAVELPSDRREGWLWAETLRNPPRDPTDRILRHAKIGQFGCDHSETRAGGR